VAGAFIVTGNLLSGEWSRDSTTSALSLCLEPDPKACGICRSGTFTVIEVMRKARFGTRRVAQYLSCRPSGLLPFLARLILAHARGVRADRARHGHEGGRAVAAPVGRSEPNRLVGGFDPILPRSRKLTRLLHFANSNAATTWSQSGLARLSTSMLTSPSFEGSSIRMLSPGIRTPLQISSEPSFTKIAAPSAWRHV
jgi:hypothetical protein